MTFSRTLVISDIHGCYDEFAQLLKQIRYNPDCDQLILLGDYVSRGPNSKSVVEHVMTLVQTNGAIALQGNHDYRFVKVMEGTAETEDITKFFKFGGEETLKSFFPSFQSVDTDVLAELRMQMTNDNVPLQFLKQLPYHFEDEHYIYVHAGINPMNGPLEHQTIYDLLYIKEAFYKHPTGLEKTIIFGHTLTMDIHDSPDIWFSTDKIGIDGGCAFGYQLNCLEIIEGNVTRTYAVRK